MRMRIPIVLMLIAGLLLSVGCEKYTSDEPASSGVYLGGKRVVSIGSTFMGGGIASPLLGSSHLCQMYEQYFEQGQSWNQVASVVTITGFRYTDVTYSEPGQYLDFISISGAVLDLDTSLVILLNQGEYKGGCELVSSVRITNYDVGTIKNQKTGERNDDGKIDIEISLTDGRTLRIHYRGKILNDGYDY